MLSHESRALAAPSTLLDAGIYHPAPRTLFYSTLSAGLLPYFAPTFLLTGNPTLALDLAFLGARRSPPGRSIWSCGAGRATISPPRRAASPSS